MTVIGLSGERNIGEQNNKGASSRVRFRGGALFRCGDRGSPTTAAAVPLPSKLGRKAPGSCAFNPTGLCCRQEPRTLPQTLLPGLLGRCRRSDRGATLCIAAVTEGQLLHASVEVAWVGGGVASMGEHGRGKRRPYGDGFARALRLPHHRCGGPPPRQAGEEGGGAVCKKADRRVLPTGRPGVRRKPFSPACWGDVAAATEGQPCASPQRQRGIGLPAAANERLLRRTSKLRPEPIQPQNPARQRIAAPGGVLGFVSRRSGSR